MRELILQGGEVLKFEEENHSGKTDIEVSDVFQLHGVKFHVLCWVESKEVNDVFRPSLSGRLRTFLKHGDILFFMICKSLQNYSLQLSSALDFTKRNRLFCSSFSLGLVCCKTFIMVGKQRTALMNNCKMFQIFFYLIESKHLRNSEENEYLRNLG